MAPLPHPGDGPLKTALTRAGDFISTQTSSAGSPPPRPSAHPRPAATEPTPLRSSEQRAPSVVRQRAAGSARLAWERAREGGPYLPRQSRGSTCLRLRLRLLRLGCSPASRARLEYIPSSERPGRAASSGRGERGTRPPRPSRRGEWLRPRGGAEACRPDTSATERGRRGGRR